MITDEAELQRRLLYSVIVAGKSAGFADQAMARLLSHVDPGGGRPVFDLLRPFIESDPLPLLRGSRVGNYGKVSGFLHDVISTTINLRTCAPADLEKLHGVGPKTARFFILWTRPEYRCAALDVHVLRWLRSNGYPDAPCSSPQSTKAYAKWEVVFLAEADRRGLTARELDYQIWSAANVGGIK